MSPKTISILLHSALFLASLALCIAGAHWVGIPPLALALWLLSGSLTSRD